jgi:glycolate oxidase iron-sulfur subunit
LNDQQGALPYARANIDAWWPFVEAGAEAIVITASGCGTMVKDYGHLLQHDARYAAKAARIAELAKDISEVIAAERAALLAKLGKLARPHKVAFQSPCSLQHGQNLAGVVESLLRDAGYKLTPVPDGHLCCGSAGTYSILQPELSQRLLHRKVRALEGGFPDEIATANVGCLAHLETGTAVPIRHWIELIAQRL